MRSIVLYWVGLFLVISINSVDAKKIPRQKPVFATPSVPAASASLPPDLMSNSVGPARSAAAADTFVLLDASFDSPGGQPDPMGFYGVDASGQIGTFFHVANGVELDGGNGGNLLPLSGSQSMWCGVDASTAAPFCGYETLPGYGNSWDQRLVSATMPGDSVSMTYKVFWDSEAAYDGTTVEYSFDSGQSWTDFDITDFGGGYPNVYDGTAPSPFAVDTVVASQPGASNVIVRFAFASDGAWSDQDGLFPTDGAFLVDDIAVDTWSGGTAEFSDTEDFESAIPGFTTVGIWTGMIRTGFGDFAELYPGVSLLQEDDCNFVTSFVWGFFDDPMNANYACHLPDPRPDVGVVPYGPNEAGLYMNNELWSPPFDNIGNGDEYVLRYRQYLDNTLSALILWNWGVRSWTDPDGPGPLGLCPLPWEDNNFIVFAWANRSWVPTTHFIGSRIDPDAAKLQVRVAVIDMCPVWCNIFGTGACHSHSPLFDDIRVERIATTGPQFSVRHIDLFQDNFAEDGTITGTSRADAALDILPQNNPSILPGDSVCLDAGSVGSSGGGPSLWLYARVQNSNHAQSVGADMESPDTRAGKTGARFPFVGTWTDANSETWECFQMDSVFSSTGGVVGDRYCVDLNDDYFVPGDTIHYFFCADADGTAGNGNEAYWHRTVYGQGPSHQTADREEAASSPCEFTILPAGGFNRGRDLLYVDDTDDRGGPAQLFFDSAFDILGIRDIVDRFDVLGPSSAAGNSLASRVRNSQPQMIDIYRGIIWNSGNLSNGLVGDGTGNPEKSDDFGLLEQWMRLSTNGPLLYLSGDNIAEEWSTLSGAGAILMKATQMPFTLLDRDHINFGEAVSPTLAAVGGSNFHHLGVPDVMIAYGGCPSINNFDVLDVASGGGVTSEEEFPYPNAEAGSNPGSAVLSARFTNSASTDATIFVSGFSYHNIRDSEVQFPPARVEHIDDILENLGDTPDPTGVPKDGPQYSNALYNAYPNPFNPTTTIRYSIKESGHVSLRVYNAAGQLVKTLVDDVQTPDQVKPIEWNGQNESRQTVSSGVYFYRIIAGSFVQTRKMVLLK